jgi:hypothetical protein
VTDVPRIQHGALLRPATMDELLPQYDGELSDSLLRNLQLESPHEYFEQLVTNEMIDQFVTNTNRYATYHKLRSWKDVTREEIKNFISIVLLLGITKYPTRTYAWKKSLLGNQMICEAMLPTRFESNFTIRDI